MKTLSGTILSVLLILNSCNQADKTDWVQYVNPLIGTAKTTTIAGLRHGAGTEHNAQVQPSVTVPFGMTNWSPQTANTEKKEIIGYNPVHRIYQGWGKPAGFSGYFVMQVEKVPTSFGVYEDDVIHEKQAVIENEANSGAYFSFNVKKNKVLRVKIGTSFVGIEQARNNLNAELPGFDFGKAHQNLKSEWNSLLSKIEVEGDSREDKVKFYTAMYHFFQQPRIYSDVEGTYPRFDGNVQTDTIYDGNYYCDFSVWDTYRALHGLYNLIVPGKSADMVRSLLTMGKVGGWMPIFPKWNSYTSDECFRSFCFNGRCRNRF